MTHHSNSDRQTGIDELAGALGDADYDTVRFEVDSPRGSFSIEFGADDDGHVWNVANWPPDRTPDGYEVHGADDAYTLLGSEAETPSEAYAELTELAAYIGGEAAEMEATKTFSRFRGFIPFFSNRARALYNRVAGLRARVTR